MMQNPQDVFKQFLEIVEGYYSQKDDGLFHEYKSPGELGKILDLEKKIYPEDWQSILSWIEQYLQYSVKTSHPSFVNRMWAGANLPSMFGEMAVALSNTSACTYESAPVSTLMEKYMIQQMLDLVGFTNGEGQMTTGSSNANMIAMMCARNLAGSDVKNKGLFGQQELVSFVNADAHYSMDKATNILGLGSESLVKVPVNESGEMDFAALEEALEKTVAAGKIPFFVAATEGTTVRGAYDPIEPLLKLRRKYRFWLHADGAWGGAAIMSDRLRTKFMRGLSEADSFTCDFHKMLGSALMCNVLLVNQRGNALGGVLGGGDGSYLFRDTDDDAVTDLGSASLQCGRRVDSLKWFLDWKHFGKDGFGSRIEGYLSLVEYAEECLHKKTELELLAPRVSFNLCFRYKGPEEIVNELNMRLRTRLYQSGKSLVGVAYIDKQLVMRLLITNMNVGRDEIDTFFDHVVTVGKEVMAEFSGSVDQDLIK